MTLDGFIQAIESSIDRSLTAGNGHHPIDLTPQDAGFDSIEMVSLRFAIEDELDCDLADADIEDLYRQAFGDIYRAFAQPAPTI